MMYEIQITVDINDADFVTSISSISEEDLNKIKPLIEAIDNFKPYHGHHKSGTVHNHRSNYPTEECIREDLGGKTPQELYKFDEEIFELFEKHCPVTEYGFHTIDQITIQPDVKKEIIFKRKKYNEWNNE